MSVPHAVLIARRSPTFPWRHPKEVSLTDQDHVHRALCAHAAKLPDGTLEKDKYGFPMTPSLKCCMLGDKHADVTHAKGCLRDDEHRAVILLRKWYNHVIHTNCGKLYWDLWFPAGKRVWLQVHSRGPLIRLLVCTCYLHAVFTANLLTVSAAGLC